jgi:hypothetical protein
VVAPAELVVAPVVAVVLSGLVVAEPRGAVVDGTVVGGAVTVVAGPVVVAWAALRGAVVGTCAPAGVALSTTASIATRIAMRGRDRARGAESGGRGGSDWFAECMTA